MKNILRILQLLLVTILSLPFSSCSDDEVIVTPTPTNNIEVTFTVNGGAYNNKTFTLTGGAALYEPGDDLTGITFAGKDGTRDIGCVIGWAGTKTGTRSWREYDAQDSASCGFTDGTSVFGSEIGTLSITEYGSVGGNIKGTFSGSFTLFLSKEVVSVTNGKFTVKRII